MSRTSRSRLVPEPESPEAFGSMTSVATRSVAKHHPGDASGTVKRMLGPLRSPILASSPGLTTPQWQQSKL